ncbi:hypothetical protein [Algibacter lectus]|uniref:DUF4468 domain-containing protein n=1 Tax=Algibacter lectus TaxID=221126 RepID=A0A090VIW5_9FLAO|nr:hypothetical protein [Algibacter lectus]MWW25735.1 hypothetical protein [Algibacter lectus]TDY61017.1 hypothetical protein DFQ06_3026 [Algibacter lectus]GAL63294.1 hypothetical protein JCM19300_1316 [Algibacter lectus]SFD71969.1 hypothetical protein SAMN04489722_1186 [Algibacter lectus]
MRKTLTLLAILSFLFINAQSKKGTIYLKDSTELKGLVKAKMLGGIKYKANLNSDIIHYENSQLNGYDIEREDKSVERYRFKLVQGISRKMKIVQLGKINLYSVFVTNSGSAMGMGMGAGMSLPASSGYVYFLEKNNVTIRTGAWLKKRKFNLIEDCPTLIDKIKKKEFKKKQVVDIINYYNKECV